MFKLNKGQWIAVGVVGISLSLIAYQATRSQSTVTFYTPQEVYQDPQAFQGKTFRVSGLVLKGTKVWDGTTNTLVFSMTDLQGHDFHVRYRGVPPDLFKEGQGVVVEGMLAPDWNAHQIQASLLMVKHSEVYDTKQDPSRMRQAKLLESMSQSPLQKGPSP